MNHFTGDLQIVCEKKGQKTIVKDVYYEGALKITRPVYLADNGEAYLYVMNPGGGFVDGDAYRIEIALEEEAEVVVTSQSSTKIYKTLKQPVQQDIKITLKKGSKLEYLPDPVIAYQQAKFKQRTVVKMEQGASLICTDIFTPGWAVDGTLFRYDLLQSRMNVYLDEQLVLFDHLKLEPDAEISEMGSLEGFTHFGTMMVIDELVTRSLIDELYEMLVDYPDSKIGLSMLSVPGFTLRILGNSTQEIEKILQSCHKHIKMKIFNRTSPFLRKY